MENTPSVLNPVHDIQISGGKVEVKEMAWPHALKFYQMLSKYASQFVDSKGGFSFSPEKLTDLVCNASEVSEHLILSSTGKDKAWLDSLPFSDAMLILDGALAVNLSEEVIGKAKKPLSRFGQVAVIKTAVTKGLPASSTT